MPQGSARHTALHALGRWREGREFADAIAQSALGSNKLASADRAFALDLFYSSLRNLTLLDFWIGRLRAAPLEPTVRDVVRLGLVQIFLLETSEHAAVFETVELVSKRQRGVVNGILRAALRQRENLQALAQNQSLHIRLSHPEFLIDKWRAQFGDNAAEMLCAWDNQPPPIYVRTNALRPAAHDNELSEVEPISDKPGFFRVKVLPHSALERGAVYVQDPSTALAPVLLEVQPGEVVLDACAAPGGKTAYIAGEALNRAEIVASDRDEARLEVLRTNLDRMGVRALVIEQDWSSTQRSSALRKRKFDKILVDVPCSNTGVMRRRVDVRWRLTEKDFVRMPDLQLEIMQNVAPLLKPGGVLVYSTCSLEPEENELNVERILRELPQLRLTRTVRVTPWDDGVDGAFAARLESA